MQYKSISEQKMRKFEHFISKDSGVKSTFGAMHPFGTRILLNKKTVAKYTLHTNYLQGNEIRYRLCILQQFKYTTINITTYSDTWPQSPSSSSKFNNQYISLIFITSFAKLLTIIFPRNSNITSKFWMLQLKYILRI